MPFKIKGMSAYGTVWRVLGLRGADIFKATTCAAISALPVLSILRKSLSFANFEFAERNLPRFAIRNLFDHALQQVSVHFKQGNMQILHQQDQVVQPVEDLAQGSNQLLVRDNTAFESRSKERSSKMRERVTGGQPVALLIHHHSVTGHVELALVVVVLNERLYVTLHGGQNNTKIDHQAVQYGLHLGHHVKFRRI